MSSRCSIGSPEHLVPGAAPVSSRCLQAPAGDHGPVLNQAIEYRSNAQSAIISAFQLSAIFAKPSTATVAPTPNPHSRQAFTAFPRVRSSEAFRRRPYTGSIARAGPASETLPDSGCSRNHDRAAGFDPKEPFRPRRWIVAAARKRTFAPLAEITSSASVPHLPDADQSALQPVVRGRAGLRADGGRDAAADGRITAGMARERFRAALRNAGRHPCVIECGRQRVHCASGRRRGSGAHACRGWCGKCQ